MLQVKDIDVFHGDVQALWNVSLSVNKSEIVAIVGANGAGKSTLLRAISGLMAPQRGRIQFLSQRISGLAADHIVKLGISHVPEGRQLFPYMNVLETLELGAAHIPHAWRDRHDSLKRVFELFPILSERSDQPAGTLSGGQQQMLAIGRALMSKPKLLMLDEPSLGLAPKVVEEVFRAVQQINKQGVTVLLVEQNVRRSLALADRAYVLEVGRVALEGTGAQLSRDEHVKEAYLGI